MHVADDPVPSGEISWVAMNWLQHVAIFRGIIELPENKGSIDN